ncbi:MAG: hypothetical protein C4329_15655 [Chitinophagaceae bacterium]
MQDSILSTTATQRIYSQSGITIGSLMGWPIVAGYLLSKNYTALVQNKKAGKTWLLCIATFVLLVTLASVLPQQVPNASFVFANAALGYYMTQSLQGKLIDAHIVSGGLVYSNWRCAGIALIFTVILVVLALGDFYAMDLYTGRL